LVPLRAYADILPQHFAASQYGPTASDPGMGLDATPPKASLRSVSDMQAFSQERNGWVGSVDADSEADDELHNVGHKWDRKV
jgi:hypothetical protein